MAITPETRERLLRLAWESTNGAKVTSDEIVERAKVFEKFVGELTPTPVA